MNAAVTTSMSPPHQLNEKAQAIAQELGLPHLSRERKSVSSLLRDHKLDFLLVVEQDRLLVRSLSEELFWHPGTVIPKLRDLKKFGTNPLLKAAAVEEGMSVLDCTLGYGSDAILLASAVGPSGKVTGIEANKLIAFLTQDGLRHYPQVNKRVRAIMERIEVVQDTYEHFLSEQPDNSFDVVYFDPMFRIPKKDSVSINLLRSLAETAPLTPDDIQSALRVCRSRVVVKERIGSGVFRQLGITQRVGDIRYGEVVYGYIEKNPAK